MWMDGDSSVMGISWPLIISWSLPVTLWVSQYLMTTHIHLHKGIHTQRDSHRDTRTRTHTHSRFVTSFYSDYWTGRVIMRSRWEEVLIGQIQDRLSCKTNSKRSRDRGTNGKRRGLTSVNGEGEWKKGKLGESGGVHGRPQIHGFDICVLLDSLTTACLSCSPLHLHPLPKLPHSISPIGRL